MQEQPVIVFLCDYQAPYGGNFIASMARLYAVLKDRGVQTLFLFPQGAKARPWSGMLAQLGAQVSYFDRDASLCRQLVQLERILDACHATILHTHFGCFLLSELAALRRPKLRLLLHFHSDFSAGKPAGVLRRVRNSLKRIPEALIGKKRLQKITVSETSAMTTPDCISLHNALVPERFAEELWDREQTRRAYHVAPESVWILVFGWSPYIKGVDLAARALSRLWDCGRREFILGLVCGREYPAPRMRSFLQERAGCTGQEPWLRLLPPVEDVFRYHKAADIMLSASRSETFSYALLEALFSQKSCVCSDIPGVLWAKRFDTVRFFPSEDSNGLTNALLAAKLDSSSESFPARAQAVSETVQKEYAIEAWCDGLLGVYGIGSSPESSSASSALQ